MKIRRSGSTGIENTVRNKGEYSNSIIIKYILILNGFTWVLIQNHLMFRIPNPVSYVIWLASRTCLPGIKHPGLIINADVKLLLFLIMAKN